MSHKVHPKVFRIKDLKDWDSRWFNRKNTPQYLEEDFKIKRFIGEKLKEASVERIEIERFPGKIQIIISTARPGMVVGRRGGGVELLKKELERMILKYRESLNKKETDKPEIKIEVKEVKDPWLSTALIAQWMAVQIEKRVPYRRVLKQAIEKASVSKETKGVRLEVSGRLNGAEISRREWLQKGQMPRHNLRAQIDYSAHRARCTYGTIGIKVWLYKGEKFD